MVEGPLDRFDFPRVTDIGPFTETAAEQEFKRQDNNTFVVGSDVDREVATVHGVDLDNVNVVVAELKVREFIPEKDEVDSIIERAKRQIDVITRDTSVAIMEYWYDDFTGVAKIFDVEVKEPFRQMGIATTLKEQELDYMRNKGIELVYTDIISEGGYRLAKSTEFKPIQQADHLRGTEAMLSFNTDKNRGVMFRYL